MRILYVEDEEFLAEAVIHLLKKADILVDWATNGEEGLNLALAHRYDCIVLDIMLPGLSGWEILQALRRHQNSAPVIMLSALSEVDDKVQALDLGADDYLAKPFKTAELIARIRALTRRPQLCSPNRLKFGDLVYDKNNRTLNGLELMAKEALILELFLQQPEQLLPKERLLTYVWGDNVSASNSYVEVYISYLRKKLKQLGSSVRIVASRNLGYKITEK